MKHIFLLKIKLGDNKKTRQVCLKLQLTQKTKL